MKNFGSRLRELRKLNNMTQKQLAERIGVRNSIISFYEVGERTPSPEILIKLSRVFHVSTDYLLGIEKDSGLDVSGLKDDDKQILLSLIAHLRSKN